MAILPSGIAGPFIGSAGNFTGYLLNGKNILRGRRRSSSKPMTGPRLAQQQKIKVCNTFTSAFRGTGFLTVTFPAHGRPGSGYNRLTSLLMNQAILGAYPRVSLAWESVKISQGHLAPAAYPAVAAGEDGTLHFSWTDTSGENHAAANDQAVLVAYAPGLQKAVFSMTTAHRADCYGTLAAPHFCGHAVETWIGFVSEDRRDAANSLYTGRQEL